MKKLTISHIAVYLYATFPYKGDGVPPLTTVSSEAVDDSWLEIKFSKERLFSLRGDFYIYHGGM